MMNLDTEKVHSYFKIRDFYCADLSRFLLLYKCCTKKCSEKNVTKIGITR